MYQKFAIAMALAACLAGLAACGTTPSGVPVAPADVEVAPERVAVDPEIDAWFRSTTPTSSEQIVAGDVLDIEVQGKPDLGVTRPVPASGLVPIYQTDRTLNVLEMTPTELEKEIADAYRSAHLQNPYVTVTIVQRAPRVVYVAGAVEAEGEYELKGAGGLSVLQAITRAGGKTDDADLYAVTILRYHPGRGVRVSSPPLNIHDAQESGIQIDDLYLLPGDTVTVPDAKTRRIHVLGHVERPGPVAWYEGLTISMAVTECGGFKKFARTNKIAVVRLGHPTIVFDFDEVIDGEQKDMLLEPGDRVFVPERLI